jgi:hypothetical protein
VKVKSATTLTAKASAATSVVPGSYDLTVSVPGTSTTCAGCLAVAAQPTVTSIAPSSLAQGASKVIVTVDGTGFVGPAKVSFTGPGSGVRAVVKSLGATSLSLEVSVAATVVPGAYTLKLTNGNGAVALCAACLTIAAAPAVT